MSGQAKRGRVGTLALRSCGQNPVGCQEDQVSLCGHVQGTRTGLRETCQIIEGPGDGE
jgi:hypothetical protein